MDNEEYDIDDEIDWAELQEFFYSDLKPKLFVLDALCAAGDVDKLAGIGHSLKGSGGGVKLPRFTDFGKLLEDSGKISDLAGCIDACRQIRDEYAKHHPNEAAELARLFSREGRAAA